MRALSIIFTIIEAYSRTPAIFGVKPFWISASIKSLCSREEKIESRSQEVNTSRGTDYTVMGLKLAGSSLLPFL